MTVATLAAALVLFGLRAKTGTSPALLACMLLLWAAGFFLALLAQQLLPLAKLPQEAQRFYADASDALERQRRLDQRQDSSCNTPSPGTISQLKASPEGQILTENLEAQMADAGPHIEEYIFTWAILFAFSPGGPSHNSYPS